MADDAVLVDNREEVIVRGRAGRARLGALLVVAGVDAGEPAQPVHAVLADPDAVLEIELVAEEPVAQGRVVGMQFVELVDEVGIVPVPLTHRAFKPLVVRLPGKAEDPQRHRDRHPDRGTGRSHLSDEREDYFPGRFAWDR